MFWIEFGIALVPNVLTLIFYSIPTNVSTDLF